MNNIVFELNVKNDKRVIPEIASFVSECAYKLGLSKKKAYYLCFTIESILELRTDQISERNPDVKIIAEDNGSYFKFSVIDFGAPYILTDNQQTILQRKLVDRYSFSQNGRKGQCLSFTYKYQPEVVEIKKEDKELLDEEFSFRRLNKDDEDILKAVTCLYDAYGYDYYHQHLYSVESFKKYMANGRYVPIIGENKHLQALTYCALDENAWFEGVPEFSNLVTSPIARGKGLASKIFVEAEKIAQEMNYEGIHVSAVAYHPYTQMMSNKLNYVPCAIEYSINPKGTGGSSEDRRLDCVIGAKIFNKTKKHDLYLMKECNELFKSIYDELALNYEIHNEQLENINDESIITYVIDTDTSNCFVKIDKCDKNIKQTLLDLANNKEVQSVDVLTINLMMNDIGAIDGYKVLKQLGFICTGCIPGSKNGDYMLLQKFKDKPAYDKIVLEDNYQILADKVCSLNKIQ